MDTLHILQQYWWALVSLLGALLVFLMFVQGGQTMLYGTAKTEAEKRFILTIMGHKWEITFTTLVVFGGAAFASFPLFYSTSFGGAYWLWLSILFLFVVQAVSYEFRSRGKNLLGIGTYDVFLFLNGLLGTFLIGVAVATFYSGGAFFMDKANITDINNPTVSYWANGWLGLDQIVKPFNILLGILVLLAARTLGFLYIQNTLPLQIANPNGGMDDTKDFSKRVHLQLIINGIAFVLLFVLFLVILCLRTGYQVDPSTGLISPVKYKYFFNFIELIWPLIVLLVGVVLVLIGLIFGMFVKDSLLGKKSFYVTGLGVVLAVWPILICAAFNNTSYFHSTVNLQDSLTLYNSSSSLFTLEVMAFVSILIPFVLWYIIYAWRKMVSTNTNGEY